MKFTFIKFYKIYSDCKKTNKKQITLSFYQNIQKLI